MVDQNGDCIAVTVYNLTAGKGFNIGDSVAIPEPFLQETNVALDEDKVMNRYALSQSNIQPSKITKLDLATFSQKEWLLLLKELCHISDWLDKQRSR